MKLLSDYSLAVYSAKECKLFKSRDAANLAGLSSLNNDPRPSSQSLEFIQQGLQIDREDIASRVIILVPDTWLSVSQHRIDHQIPSSLLPLAAMSYAVETTYSVPDSLLFSYQYQELSAQQSLLTVYACTNEWADELCLPFSSKSKTCLLMSVSQWTEIQSRKMSWHVCSEWALSKYNPEKEKRLKAKRLYWSLVVFSLLLHIVASTYFFSLDQESTDIQLARKTIQATQSSWASNRHSEDFSSSILGLIQTLPASARLGHFESKDRRAFLQMTLPAADLQLLLAEWRQHNPDWQWEVEQKPHRIDAPATQKEVVDVSIEVFKG